MRALRCVLFASFIALAAPATAQSLEPIHRIADPIERIELVGIGYRVPSYETSLLRYDGDPADLDSVRAVVRHFLWRELHGPFSLGDDTDSGLDVQDARVTGTFESEAGLPVLEMEVYVGWIWEDEDRAPLGWLGPIYVALLPPPARYVLLVTSPEVSTNTPRLSEATALLLRSVAQSMQPVITDPTVVGTETGPHPARDAAESAEDRWSRLPPGLLRDVSQEASREDALTDGDSTTTWTGALGDRLLLRHASERRRADLVGFEVVQGEACAASILLLYDEGRAIRAVSLRRGTTRQHVDLRTLRYTHRLRSVAVEVFSTYSCDAPALSELIPIYAPSE